MLQYSIAIFHFFMEVLPMKVRKRQFGTEKDSFALPVRHTREHDRKLSINRDYAYFLGMLCFVNDL